MGEIMQPVGSAANYEKAEVRKREKRNLAVITVHVGREYT